MSRAWRQSGWDVPERHNRVVPTCVECGAVWLPVDEERWRLREVDLDEFAWYCRTCGEREFGDR